MKGSQINQALRKLGAVAKEYRYTLPPFCHITPGASLGSVWPFRVATGADSLNSLPHWASASLYPPK